MCGGHRPCGRGEVKFSIFHITSRDLVIRGSLWVSFPHRKWPLYQAWWPLVLQRRRYFVFNLSRDFMWPRGQRFDVTLWMSSPHYKSPSYQVWRSQALCMRRNFDFSLSRDPTSLRGQRVMWHYGWVFFVISVYPAKFGDHRPFGRGDVKVSICQVTSRDHVVRGSDDIMGVVSLS